MAVSGRIHGSVSLRSDHSCEPCLTTGEHVEAHGFCVDCKEYLCKTCFDYHKRTKALRNHQLFDKGDVGKQTFTSKDSGECTEKCSVHKKEIIKFFCPTHEALGCNDCIILYHRTCKIDYIPDNCSGIGDSDEYMDIVKKMDQKKAAAEIVMKKAESKDKEIDECHASNIEEILRFRKEIDDRLDQLQQKVQKAADERKFTDKQLIRIVLDECANASSDIKQMQSSMQANKSSRQNGQLYIGIKRAELKLKSDKLRKADENLAKSNMQYTFRRNTDLENLLFKQDVFGNLATPVKKAFANLTHKENINVKTKTDINDCFIAGCAVLPSNKLVLADRDNSKLKVVDTQSKAVIEEKALGSKPWDIAVLPRDQIAVTMPEKKMIQVLATSGHLSTVRSMPLEFKCFGIVYHKGHLYMVCSDPKSVLVLDMQGNVQNTISLNNNIINDPQYIALSERSNNIYISCGSRCVVSVTLQGDVSAVYKHEDLSVPKGMLMLANGSLVVCSYWNDAIHHISGDLKKGQMMIDGLKSPTSICYSHRLDEVYVGGFEDLLQVLGRK